MRTDSGGDVPVFEDSLEDGARVRADFAENFSQDKVVRIEMFIVCKGTCALKWTQTHDVLPKRPTLNFPRVESLCLLFDIICNAGLLRRCKLSAISE
jgi:hypothetical protein